MEHHDCQPGFSRHVSRAHQCRARELPSRKAAAIVELAIVLPVMLTIGMMTIDFGRTVSAYLVMANAARAGADYGATHRVTPLSRPAWENYITTAIQTELSNLSRYNPSRSQSNISTSTNSDGSLQVAVDVQYSLETIVPWPGVPASVPLHYRVEMRQYQ